MGKYECKFCHSFRQREDSYIIDSQHKVLNVHYECGTILKLTFPEGDGEWFRACQGVSSQRLDKYRKLPDN